RSRGSAAGRAGHRRCSPSGARLPRRRGSHDRAVCDQIRVAERRRTRPTRVATQPHPRSRTRCLAGWGARINCARRRCPVRPDHQPPYASPAAFRRALTDRLRVVAAPHGPWPLPDLQRQFAYDRLLARLYLLDDAWILKGATAMLARRIAVRHTIDIDIYRAVQ